MGTRNRPGPRDCWDRAEDDEPRFALLGRDPIAPSVIRIWCTLRQLSMFFMNDHEANMEAAKIKEAQEVADAMERWRIRKEEAGDVRASDREADSLRVVECARMLVNRGWLLWRRDLPSAAFVRQIVAAADSLVPGGARVIESEKENVFILLCEPMNDFKARIRSPRGENPPTTT